MCGFIGAYGPSSQRLRVNLPKALDSIAHRGPDAEGIYISNDRLCILGHRRLSIIDLSEQANQPMQRNQSALVFNGEIYNHQKLRTSFWQDSHQFSTHSDTETLLMLLQTLEFKQLNILNGMYAGAFYNEKLQQLTLLGLTHLFLHE